MKYYTTLFLLLLLQCSYACGNTAKNESRQSSEESRKDAQTVVPSEVKYPILFDYEKKYPRKEIVLQDIADVTYSKFSDKDVLFGRGTGIYLSVSNQFKITCSPKEGTVFVFDKNNKLINKFNCTRGGPKEYQSLSHLYVDFSANEIFIFDFPVKYRVLVYSFDGKFKREFGIKRPLWIESALDYDMENMLVCFKLHKTGKIIDRVERQYYLMSKANGRLTPIKVNIKYPISNTILTNNSNGHGHMFGIPSRTIVRNGMDVVISDYGSDTIYLKNDKGLHPFIIKSPSVKDSDEPTLVYALARTDNYTFVRKVIRRREDNGMTDFAVDNKTGEIVEIKIINRDFPSKNVSIETFDKNLPPNSACYLLSTSTFIERNEENLLSGKLKEFVSTLTDDDNDFLISIKYK